MVTKWIAISILVGLGVALIPVFLVWLWTLNAVFVGAVTIFLLVTMLAMVVVSAIDHDIEMKRLQENLEQEENDENECND